MAANFYEARIHEEASSRARVGVRHLRRRRAIMGHIWSQDPGPRGCKLDRYDKLKAAGGVAPSQWKFDAADWWQCDDRADNSAR